MTAGQGVLAEDGLVTAGEREVGVFDDFSGVIFNWQADVENLKKNIR